MARAWISSLVACLAVATGTAASAAEKIVFRFGELSRDVSVPSLVDFSESGTVKPDLAGYLRLLKPADREGLRSVLHQTFPVTPVMVSNFLRTALGQSTLQQLTKVIDQPDQVARPALSSALILGAAQQGDLRLVDVLQAYPTQRLPVNVAAVLALKRNLQQQFNLQNKLFAKVSSIQGEPVQGPNLAELAKPGDRTYGETAFSFVGRDGTTVDALVYLPVSATAADPSPLVVIAPGLNTNMNALLYVGKQLASHGYAVAALDFPFTSATAIQAAIGGNGAIPLPNAWYGQPHTVSDLIDQVQERWGEMVKTDSVGALGQSLGGYTVTALAGAELDWDHLVKGCEALNDPNRVVLNPAVVWQCAAPGEVVRRKSFRDPRVKAAVALNPVTNPIFSPASLQQIDVPVMVVSGTDDIFAPPVSQQLIPFTSIQQPGSLLVFQHDGTHLSFLNGNTKLPAFVIGPDRALAREQLRGMALVFFDRHVRDQASVPPLAAPTETNGVLASQAPLPLLITPRFTREELNQVDPGLRQFP
jgi:predicted dienelactone hydrolase